MAEDYPRNKGLIVGPWVGEFGWELMCWQAYARAVQHKFKYEKVIAYTRPGNEYLYDDFCHEIKNFNPGGGIVDTWQHLDWCRSLLVPGKPPKPVYMDGFPPTEEGFDNMQPQLLVHGHPLYPEIKVQPFNAVIEPEFIDFAEPFREFDDFGVDILFCARARSFRSEDNWPREKWEELGQICKDNGLKCASIGKKSSSYQISSSVDLSELNIGELCSVMSHSKLCIGPSTGPLHLASLCKLEHLVWSKPENRRRYETLWNPFKTKVTFLDEYSWQPPVDFVWNHIQEILDGQKGN
jgi:hypothetical protein